jgi:hypothetical protein
MKFRPLHDRVLIYVLDSDEKTAGGIIIPPAVFSSLSNTLISTRSCKGLNFIYIFSYNFLCMADMVCFSRISRG